MAAPAAQHLPAPSFRLVDGARPAAALAGSYLTVTVVALLHVPAVAGALLVAAVVALCSVGARLPTALGCGLLGWLFVTGFVVNHDGVLRLAGSADLARLAVLLLVPLAVARATAALSRRHARSGDEITEPAPPGRPRALASRRVV